MSDTITPGASIALPAGFHFDEVKPLLKERLLLPLNASAPLGILEKFTGTFAGKGFNLIFRPQGTATPTPMPVPAHGIPDNVLELNLTTETLAFTGALGNVPNRGNGAQADIFLNGIPYVQTVNDVTNGSPVTIHVEPGLWIAVPATAHPVEPITFARMGSIPHGTTINLQGTASPAVPGAPVIPKVDPTPFFDVGLTFNRFASQTAGDNATFRIPQDLSSHIADGSITQAIIDDPNTVLRNALVGQTIVETVTLDVASFPTTPAPAGALHIPAEGGGTANIAFLTANANVPTQQVAPPPAPKLTIAGARSTFWIETVEHQIHVPVFNPGHLPVTVPSGLHPVLKLAGPSFVLNPPFAIPHPIIIKVHSTQIQYSQTVLLNFNGLTWPHVSVATLIPSTPVIVSPVAWEAIRKTL